MKIAFYRPHADPWFHNTVNNIVRGRRMPNKYTGLLDHVLASGHQVYFATAVKRPGGLKATLKWLFEPAELIVWCLLNKIKLRRIGIVWRAAALHDKDVLLFMHYGNFTHESKAVAMRGKTLAQRLADTPALKVVHMTHYAYNAGVGNANLVELKPDLLTAENDLSANSAFFAHYFRTFRDCFTLLPFTPKDRFVNTKPFADRVNKLVVTGSITFKMRDEEFEQFFGVDELQPLRRAIYESAKSLEDEIECLVSDLNASRAATPPQNWYSILLARLTRRDSQSDYYRKDIVAIYNDHRMFAVPEEICDLPAIGFVEGMACGCAFFGLDSRMYRDIGMVPGIHYVAYDGTLKDLLAKVRHFQVDVEALGAIARRGHDFVKQNLTAQVVFTEFMARLEAGVAAKRAAHG